MKLTLISQIFSIASAYSIANLVANIAQHNNIPKGSASGIVNQDTSSHALGGFMTFYNFNGGTGSCGSNQQDSDLVVALPPGQVQCGRQIQIHATNGNSCTARVVDTCPGCGGSQIDATPGVWQTLGLDQSKGVVNVDWSYI
jgi:hypothetical protein